MNTGTHRQSKAQRLALDGILAALTVVLGFLSIRIGNIMKISLEDLPVIFAALLYGPADGAAVACVGIFLYQMFSFGFTATTALWILPFVVTGVIIGLFAKKAGYNNTNRQILLLFILGELLIWIMNTGAIYADSKIYGYYYPTIITGMLAIRCVTAVIKGLVLGLISPSILKMLSRITYNGRR
ncbi:MAG: ECF transporter S component [Eubacterium sp.]|nr:ECF transporter S component [Eubacterium sp.]